MPDVEITVFRHGEHHIASIGTDAWQHGTLVQRVGSKHQLAWAKLHGLWVETLLIDIVFQFPASAHQLVDARLAVVLALVVGAAIVQRLAIGCPGREHLKLGGVVLQVRNLVLVNVVGNDVAGLVVYLNLVGVGGMKTLVGPVGGIDERIESFFMFTFLMVPS